jgi:hypothetical protein
VGLTGLYSGDVHVHSAAFGSASCGCSLSQLKGWLVTPSSKPGGGATAVTAARDSWLWWPRAQGRLYM